MHEDAAASTTLSLRDDPTTQPPLNKPHPVAKIPQQVHIGMVLDAQLELREVRQALLQLRVVVEYGEHVGYACCGDEVGLVEGVEAADVEGSAGAGDEVEPAHGGGCGGQAVDEVGHVGVVGRKVEWGVGAEALLGV